jgi:hypothetical protein
MKNSMDQNNTLDFSPQSNWRVGLEVFRDRLIKQWTAERVERYQACAGRLDSDQRDRHKLTPNRVENGLSNFSELF